jgi:REP element-mobilizing transposase RayT
VTLDKSWRTAVQEVVIEVYAYRAWTLHALHVRATHIHAVVTATASAEKALNDFKAYATRRLRREKLADEHIRVWAVHGSARYVWNDNQLAEAVDYVVNRQGALMEPLPIGGHPVANAPGSDRKRTCE